MSQHKLALDPHMTAEGQLDQEKAEPKDSNQKPAIVLEEMTTSWAR